MIGMLSRERRLGIARTAALALLCLFVLPIVLLGASVGALETRASSSPPAGAAIAWRDDVPADMAALYGEASLRFAVPDGVLAAVGKVESDHGRDPLSLVANAAGAVGPMQFLPTTFAAWSWASGSPEPSIADPRDAIFAAAAKLAADGVGDDPERALWAYNHSSPYVAEVLAWAVAYGWRTESRETLGRAVLDHPRIDVRAIDAVDVAQSRVDTRVLSALLALATSHRVAAVGPFTRHDYYVNNTTRPSNHVFGRAVDIAAVGGSPVSTANSAARLLVGDMLSLPTDIRPDEVLSPWALEVAGAQSLSDGDHQRHVHLGFDGAGV